MALIRKFNGKIHTATRSEFWRALRSWQARAAGPRCGARSVQSRHSSPLLAARVRQLLVTVVVMSRWARQRAISRAAKCSGCSGACENPAALGVLASGWQASPAVASVFQDVGVAAGCRMFHHRTGRYGCRDGAGAGPRHRRVCARSKDGRRWLAEGPRRTALTTVGHTARVLAPGRPRLLTVELLHGGWSPRATRRLRSIFLDSMRGAGEASGLGPAALAPHDQRGGRGDGGRRRRADAHQFKMGDRT